MPGLAVLYPVDLELMGWGPHARPVRYCEDEEGGAQPAARRLRATMAVVGVLIRARLVPKDFGQKILGLLQH